MTQSLEQFLASSRDRFNRAVDDLLGQPSSEFHGQSVPLDTLFEASRYSLSNGGKRVRAVLVYGAAGAITDQGPAEALDHAACAVEMIHAYSLVHDDLPAMDNDDLRRGQPSCHRAFDEATAILVGDGLQARAFEVLAEAPGLNAQQRLDMVSALAASAGPRGMVGGQAIDIAAVDANLDLAQLQAMHALKTGALIRGALALGAIAAGANEAQRDALDEYGDHIGLAFQVVDDILDVTGDSQSLGKTGGKDAEANKPTYVKLLGLDGARQESARLLALALDALKAFDHKADPLRELARFIVERDR